VVLDRNDNYWNAAGKAKMKHIIIKYVTEYSTRLIELRSGEADIIYVPSPERPGIQALAGQLAEKITISSGASTWSIVNGAFNMAINTTDRTTRLQNPAFPDDVPSDFFQDYNMRKAFSMAFDYDNYITNVTKGLAFRLAGVVPRGMYGYDSSLAPVPFDINGAKAAYAASAWVTANGMDRGFNLTAGYNCGNTGRASASLILKAGVEQLGPNIHINSKCWDFAAYLDLTLQTPDDGPGPVGIFFIGWGPDYADPDDYVVPFAKTGGTYPLYTGFSNLTLDGLIDSAARMPNSPERLQLYKDIQKSLVDNYVQIWISEAVNFHVAKSWVKGWYPNPMISGSDLGSNMAALYKE